MNTGILLTARMGSSRLKDKHLLPVGDQPIIFYLIRRIQEEFHKEIQQGVVRIVIATPDEVENRAFERFSRNGSLIFYGSKENIPLRHLQAADAYSLDAVLSIDGDDILCSVSGMRRVYKGLESGKHYVKTTGLPFGMNSWGYSTNFLRLALETHQSDVLETGWGRIFDENRLTDILIPCSIQNDDLRFTLDYEEDYEFFKVLIDKCGDKIVQMTDEQIINVVLNEGFFRINEPISKQYWENFYRVQKQEMDTSLRTKQKDTKTSRREYDI